MWRGTLEKSRVTRAFWGWGAPPACFGGWSAPLAHFRLWEWRSSRRKKCAAFFPIKVLFAFFSFKERALSSKIEVQRRTAWNSELRTQNSELRTKIQNSELRTLRIKKILTQNQYYMILRSKGQPPLACCQIAQKYHAFIHERGCAETQNGHSVVKFLCIIFRFWK